jgi:hypothetical protein
MTGGILYIPLSAPSLSNTGAPVVGATLTVFVAGGDTLASLFADSGLSTAITNPLTSDSAGRFMAQSTVIWADDSQAYDCVLNYNNGTSFTFSTLYPLGPGVDLSAFAPINSPTFTGVPQAPSPATNDSSSKIATTSFVKAQGYAPLASPTLTGVPAGPTAAANTNTTQLATTAFVETAIGLTAPTGTATGHVNFLGLILQWTPYSLGASDGATQSINWPTPFPTAVLGQPWIAPINGALEMIGTNTVTTTGCTVQKGPQDTFARTGTVFALGN